MRFSVCVCVRLVVLLAHTSCRRRLGASLPWLRKILSGCKNPMLKHGKCTISSEGAGGPGTHWQPLNTPKKVGEC